MENKVSIEESMAVVKNLTRFEDMTHEEIDSAMNKRRQERMNKMISVRKY